MVQAVTWERIGGHGHLGSWRNPELRAARALIAAGGALFAGVYGDAPGQAEIWRYQDGAWSRVFSASASGLPLNRIIRAARIGDRVVFGAGVWKAPGAAALLVLDPATDAVSVIPVPSAEADCVECLEPLGKRLAIGLTSHTGLVAAPLMLVNPLDFREWSPVSQPEPLSGIYSLATFDNGLITGGYRRDGPAVIRRLDTTGWRDLAGTVPHPGIAYDPLPGRLPEAFVVMDGRLMVQFNIHVGLETGGRTWPGGSAIWCYDGDANAGGSWRPIPLAAADPLLLRATNFNSGTVWQDAHHFSSGCWHDANREESYCRIWRLDGDRPIPIAGGGLGGSWSDREIFAANPRGLSWVYALLPHDGRLHAALSHGIGGGQAEIWAGSAL